jgi:hypothetical protein
MQSKSIHMVTPLIHGIKRSFHQMFFALLLLFFLVPAASAQIHVVGALTRQMKLSPGDEAKGRIIVRNQSNEDCVARAYLTDYRSFADGTVTYGEAGKLLRSNAGWVHVIPRELVVSAGENASFNFIVRVPEDDTLKGTYWSMLMVEPVPEEILTPPPTRRKDRSTMRIRTVTRTGIHITTHIGDTGLRAMRFASKKIERAGGKTFLSLDIENTGERQLGLTVWAELFDGKGLCIGRFDAGRRGIYPGSSARLRVPLADVPPGKYRSVIVADNGDEHVFGARYNLDMPPPRPVRRATH